MSMEVRHEAGTGAVRRASSMIARFRDRAAAGIELADQLEPRQYERPVVLALPRGGVPVAAEVARRLHAPLDLLLVRKIGAPWQPELAVAAVVDGERPDLVIDQLPGDCAGRYASHIEAQMPGALREIERRRRLYLGETQPVSVAGCTAIVIDDGIATGTSIRAALRAVRRRMPAHLVLAVPVAPAEVASTMQTEVDELVCLVKAASFGAVGAFYGDFEQVGDDEVLAALAHARSGPGTASDPQGAC